MTRMWAGLRYQCALANGTLGDGLHTVYIRYVCMVCINLSVKTCGVQVFFHVRLCRVRKFPTIHIEHYSPV